MEINEVGYRGNRMIFDRDQAQDAIRKYYKSENINVVVPWVQVIRNSWNGLISGGDSSLSGLFGWHTLCFNSIDNDAQAVIYTYDFEGNKIPMIIRFEAGAFHKPIKWFGLVHEIEFSEADNFYHSFVGWWTDQERFLPGGVNGGSVEFLVGAEAGGLPFIAANNLAAIPPVFSSSVNQIIAQFGDNEIQATFSLPFFSGGTFLDDYTIVLAGVTIVIDSAVQNLVSGNWDVEATIGNIQPGAIPQGGTVQFSPKFSLGQVFNNVLPPASITIDTVLIGAVGVNHVRGDNFIMSAGGMGWFDMPLSEWGAAVTINVTIGDIEAPSASAIEFVDSAGVLISLPYTVPGLYSFNPVTIDSRGWSLTLVP